MIKTKVMNQRGFTLLELSVVLIIVSLLMAGALSSYAIYLKRQQITKTQDNISNAMEKIAAFQQEYGFLPCPAAPNSADLRATDCNDATALGVQRVATGTLGQSIRIGVLPVSYEDPDNPGQTRKLVSGEQAIDGWRNRLLYAVIEEKAQDPATFAGPGSIRVNRYDGTAETTQARFVVLSHGPDGVGAFTFNGTQRAPCPAAGASVDAENCTPDAVFVNNLTEARSTTGDANNYDDFIASDGDTLGSLTCGEGEELRGINITTKMPICATRDLTCPVGSGAFVGVQWVNDPSSPSGRKLEPVCRTYTSSCSPGYVLARITDDVPTCVQNLRGKCPDGEVQIGTRDSAPPTGAPTDGPINDYICAPIVEECAANEVQVGVQPNRLPKCADRLAEDSCGSGQVMVGLNEDGSSRCVAAPSCTGNDVMVGIVGGVPQCSRAVADSTCSPGQVVIGINNGSLQCAAPPTSGGSQFVTMAANGSCPAGWKELLSLPYTGGYISGAYFTSGVDVVPFSDTISQDEFEFGDEMVICQSAVKYAAFLNVPEGGICPSGWQNVGYRPYNGPAWFSEQGGSGVGTYLATRCGLPE